MTKHRGGSSTSEFERALTKSSAEKLVLRLYITGNTSKSTKAIENIRRICEGKFPGRYDLEVIDIYQQPKLAQGDQIIAAPTLIKKLPPPMRKLIGDLSNEENVLLGLDIKHP